MATNQTFVDYQTPIPADWLNNVNNKVNILANKGINIASAAAINLGAATGDYVVITGTTTITSFGTADAGTERTLVFSGVLTLTHNATSLILPGGVDIVTDVGDIATFRSEGSGNWRCTGYQPNINGLKLGGTAARIVGDFSNATVANRVMFQTSTAGAITSVAALPNGGGFGAAYTVFSTSDPANAVVGVLEAVAGGAEVRFRSTRTGSASLAPMTFHTGGAEAMRIDTGGNLGVGCSPVSGTASKLFSNGDITAVGGARGFHFNSYYSSTNGRWEYAGSGTAAGLYDAGGGAYVFQSTGSTSGTAGTAASMVERFRIDASGNATFTGTVTATNLFGQGQTWQDVTGSRVVGTTYYNTTGKPIQVAITGAAGTSSGGSIIVNGLTVITNSASVGGSTNKQGAAVVIPAGASYSAIDFTLGTWFELR